MSSTNQRKSFSRDNSVFTNERACSSPPPSPVKRNGFSFLTPLVPTPIGLVINDASSVRGFPNTVATCLETRFSFRWWAESHSRIRKKVLPLVTSSSLPIRPLLYPLRSRIFTLRVFQFPAKFAASNFHRAGRLRSSPRRKVQSLGRETRTNRTRSDRVTGGNSRNPLPGRNVELGASFAADGFIWRSMVSWITGRKR